MNILTDLFQFLRKPDFVSIQDNAGNKIKILFTLFLCLLVIMFGMNVVLRILQVIVTNISLTSSTAGQATQIPSWWKTWNLFQIILLSPIFEEFCYRYALGQFNVTRIKISVSLIIAFHISYLLYFYKLHQLCESNLILHFFSLYGSMFTIATILFLIMSLCNKQLALLKNKWNSNFSFIFYLSAVLFAIYHVYNMPVLFLLSLFAGALIFGYTRIRLGLGYAIALHILWNFLSSFRLFIN